MNVLKLIEELEDIIENCSSIPFVQKVLVSKGEVLEIIKEIRIHLPDEIKQAQWIKEERQRILKWKLSRRQMQFQKRRINIFYQ